MVRPQFLPGETLSAAKLQELASVDTIWFPTLIAQTTTPTLGAAAQLDGVIWISGQKVDVWFKIIFGTSGVNAGSGTYYLPLPSDYPASTALMPTGCTIGEATLYDSSAPSYSAGSITLAGDSAFIAISGGGLVNHANPYVWAASDQIVGHYSYLTDFGE